MKAKRIVAIISLAVILAAGVFAMIFASTLPRTYDGNADAVAPYENPQDYDVTTANSVADVIVKENLDKTMAANNVAAVVFDFRGFDTLGESFILLTAIAGSFVILSKSKKKKKEEDK
ncbi:MAG: hypothetical protein IIV97_00845 [Oscillospiraceae bacterium]|nr:hypothetical protein [Oscillospiraceae bacterium]